MATRRSNLGAGIQQAAGVIAQAVNRADDIARAEEQLAVENTRADIAQDQQQQLINIQLAAEERLSRNADFDQANTVLGQLGEVTGAQAMTLFGDSAVSEALANAFSPEELEGFVLNESNAEQLRLDYLNEDIRLSQVEGAGDEAVRRGQIARNIFRGLGAADDAQLALADTDARTRLEISVQQGEDMLRRAQEDPNFLLDGQFLQEPYTSTMFGVTTNDPAQALELIKLEQANLAASGSSGAARLRAVGELRDIYIRQADERGVQLDPLEVESIINAVQTGTLPEGVANLGEFLAQRSAQHPEAAEFYQQILAGAYTPRALGADNPQEAFAQIQRDFPGEDNENIREFLTQQVAALAAPGTRVLIESDGGFFGRRGFEAGVTPGEPINLDDPEQFDAAMAQARQDISSGARSVEDFQDVSPEMTRQLMIEIENNELSETVPRDVPSFLTRFLPGEEGQIPSSTRLQNLGLTRSQSLTARDILSTINSEEQFLISGEARGGLGALPLETQRENAQNRIDRASARLAEILGSLEN